jgi:hypothetical protein
VFPDDFSIREVIKAITQGRLSDIPDRALPSMKALVLRCWSLNPADRPLFDEILTELENVKFNIVPDADAETVKLYVCGVCDWEQMRQYEELKSL